MRGWIATWKALMYISARARPHDGSNSHHDGAGLLHRGANGCTSIVFAGCSTQDHASGRHTFYHPILPLCHCNLPWRCKLTLNLFDQRITLMCQWNRGNRKLRYMAGCHLSLDGAVRVESSYPWHWERQRELLRRVTITCRAIYTGCLGTPAYF
jgi:hypothetical protein